MCFIFFNYHSVDSGELSEGTREKMKEGDWLRLSVGQGIKIAWFDQEGSCIGERGKWT